MKIVNINYRGRVLSKTPIQLPLPMLPPHQLIFKGSNKEKLLVFKSGKCRLMGCKKPIESHRITFCNIPIIIEQLMSMTVTMDMGSAINLYNLAEKLSLKNCTFEPELFSGLRLLRYNPICVNVFASGRCTILGLRTLDYETFCLSVKDFLSQYI